MTQRERKIEKRGGWEEGDLHRAAVRCLKQEAGQTTEAALFHRHNEQTPQWESCREQACTTLRRTHRIKASTHFKIHPMKGKGGDISYTQTPTEKIEHKMLSGELLLMKTFCEQFANPFIKVVGTLCLASTFFLARGVLRDDPSIRVSKKGQVGEQISQVLKQTSCPNWLFVIGVFFFFFFFYPLSLGTPGPRCHSPALRLKLSRQICIEKPFAYQTAGTQSSHHLSLIYREMHVVLTCWSACPLYLHLPFVGIS